MAWNVTPARSRKAVAPIFCALVAGGVLRHELDLTDWLDANDVSLAAGTFDVSSSYQVPAGMIADAWKPCGTPVAGGALTPEMRDDGSRAVWSGTLTSNTARFRVG